MTLNQVEKLFKKNNIEYKRNKNVITIDFFDFTYQIMDSEKHLYGQGILNNVVVFGYIFKNIKIIDQFILLCATDYSALNIQINR